MLAGHYAPAYAIKRWAPEVPLWVLFLAVQAVDIAFFGPLMALGLESMTLRPEEPGPLALSLDRIPYSHSLAMTLVYAIACVLAGLAAGRAKLGVALGLAVGSHWVADLLVHLPDLPLGPGSDVRLGLGLWSQPLLAFLLEVGLVVGAYLWLRPELQGGRSRRRGDLILAVLLLFQVANVFVLPTPGSVVELAITAQVAFFALVLLAAGVDRGLPRASETLR